MNDEAQMQKVITRYFEVWKTQDTEGLSEIFTDNAKYIVHPFGVEEYSGIDAIRGYWRANPVGKQIKPQPSVISQAFGDELAFVEWETVFEKTTGGTKKVRGMLLLEFEGGLIKQLREHYNTIDL